jgi:glycosyltransferase involved in cell wall biosynthesis
MRKVKVTRIVARLNIGGPAVHIINLTTGLDPDRFDSQLIVGRPGPDEGDMGYQAAQKGIDPLTIPELGRELSPLGDLRTTVKLARIFRRDKPDIVETHTAKAGAVGRLAARLANVPIVIHVFHGHVFHSYFGPLRSEMFVNFERTLARITDRIITVSPAQRRDIVDVYGIAPPERVLTVPLGLDLEPFRRAKQTCHGRFRASLGVPTEALLVGFVGRLTAVKNPSLFVESAGHVVQQFPQTRFVFVGDGELRPALEEQTDALGLAQHVIFAGWQVDMPAVYADLDLLALTSLNEGTPVTVIEALATGIPVVASAVGGVPDVLKDQETGTLVPSGDAERLAKAIIELLRAPERGQVLAYAGQQSVLGRFDLARLINVMDSLYFALLKEKGMDLQK